MKDLVPTILLILDGWGMGKQDEKINAIFKANTPTLDHLFSTCPWSLLKCSGEAVGLPAGQMGNSEVGHMNIGAGRIVYQDIVRIDKAIKDGSFFQNEVLLSLYHKVRERKTTLHLMGLLSDGGVHSHENHLYALLEMAKREGLSKVVVHCFLDGRDTPPQSGIEYLARLKKQIHKIGIGTIGSAVGRYYAMDRDKRWERTKLAYDMLVMGRGEEVEDLEEALKQEYAKGKGDEFIKPLISKKGFAPVTEGDGIFFFNFRADRARQLVMSFLFKDFDGFKREKHPQVEMATMTEYDKHYGVAVAFPPETYKNILGEVCANVGIHQLRIAETEKYAHVTYFFNGGREEPFEGEDRKLIPSPKEVATYDQKPEMSVYEITAELEKRWLSEKYQLVICNFANLDMVGHTGNFEATVKACEAVDSCVNRVVEMVKKRNGRLFVTADHGNADEMIDENGNIHTAHSTNPVAFIWVETGGSPKSLKDEGKLGDIAPTILDAWSIDKPKEMTGNSLIKR